MEAGYTGQDTTPETKQCVQWIKCECDTKTGYYGYQKPRSHWLKEEHVSEKGFSSSHSLMSIETMVFVNMYLLGEKCQETTCLLTADVKPQIFLVLCCVPSLCNKLYVP